MILIPDKEYPVGIGPLMAGLQLKLAFGGAEEESSGGGGALDDLPFAAGLSCEVRFGAFANLLHLIMREAGVTDPGIGDVVDTIGAILTGLKVAPIVSNPDLKQRLTVTRILIVTPIVIPILIPIVTLILTLNLTLNFSPNHNPQPR